MRNEKSTLKETEKPNKYSIICRKRKKGRKEVGERGKEGRWTKNYREERHRQRQEQVYQETGRSISLRKIKSE